MNVLDENIIDNQRRQLMSWRMGKVIRASHVGLSVWNLHAEKEEYLEWNR